MDHDSKQGGSPWRLIRPPLVRRPPAQPVCADPSTALAPANRVLLSDVWGNETAAEIIIPAGAGRLTVICGKTAPTDPRHADPRPRRQAVERPAGGFGGRKPRKHRLLRGFPNWKRSRMTFSMAKEGQRTHSGGALGWQGFGSGALRRTRRINGSENPAPEKTLSGGERRCGTGRLQVNQ